MLRKPDRMRLSQRASNYDHHSIFNKFFVRMTVIVHHLNDSRSQRILWTLEELGVPYEIKKYQRTATQQAPKELLEVHSLGKSPVITDGTITLAESGAIIEYLIAKYGKPTTISDAGYLDNLYYTHAAEASFMPLLSQKILFQIIPQKSPWVIRWILNYVFGQVNGLFLQPAIDNFKNMVEEHLSKNEYFAGGTELTSADFAMLFPLEGLAFGKLAGPNTTKYVERIQSRPAYQRALEKGGEFAYVIKK
ncbi:thioredoxin-like protein [Mycena floridula]|nr:thioredoxin-like protein [Mycena floridula]